MKKLLAVLAILGLLAINPGQSQAHSDDWGWFAAGAVAGAVTGAVLSDSCYRPRYESCEPYGYRCDYRPSYGYREYHYPRYGRYHYEECYY